jgi:hypothetical protein
MSQPSTDPAPYGAPPAPGPQGSNPTSYAPPVPPRPAGPRTNALAISGLVVGGVGLLLSFVPIINNFAAVLAIVGLVLAIVGLVRSRRLGSGKGMSIAAIIVSVLAVVGVVVSQLVYGVILDEVSSELEGASPVQTADAGEQVGEGEGTADDAASGEEVETLAAGLGETVTYPDGLAVSVSGAEPFTPTEWAAGTEGFTQFVRMDVTITNGTDEAFDPSLAFVTASSGGVEASSVFDSEAGVGGGPTTQVLPGASVTFAVAFGVSDPADLVVEVEPGPFEYDSALFASH